MPSSANDDPLGVYRSKRDFRGSPEPRGDNDGPWRRDNDNPVFVVQEHKASQLHYDLRIELDGVLKSWAVPKGPSTNPDDKRLAVAVDDHPLDYADFEGTIAQDRYGGGAVIVWDAGPYRNLKVDNDDNEVAMRDAYAQGTIEIWLEGRKLRGGYALINSRMQGKKENWLLIKMRDAGSDARRNPVSTERHSVISGRTVDEVARESSNR